MKTLSRKVRVGGFTLLEVFIVLVMVFVIAAMLLPASTGPRRSTQVSCLSQLKQIHLAYSLYATDYGNQFPMQVPVKSGGTMELIDAREVSPHFEKIRGYINNNPKSLACPADKGRQATTNFTGLNNSNISYFLKADMFSTSHPEQTIFLGDRNLAVNHQPVNSGLLTVTPMTDLGWTKEIHHRGGNLAFVDGHGEFKRNEGAYSLNFSMQRQPFATNRFCIP